MPSSSPKSALVLSAGGMFGAYQAGAWRALAGRFRPDAVIGASVGALNAWAIAGGIEPGELIGQWLDPACGRLASFGGPWQPWRGVFDPLPLHTRIESLWKTYHPRVEIGVVAIELGRLRPRLFRDGEITWRHLAASCGVLLCYPQIRLDGRLHTDGGLLGALPLWAAAELGAKHILAIDAFRQPPSRLVGGIMRAARTMFPKPPEVPHSVDVQVIAPSARMGSLREAVFWHRPSVQRWIEMGEADARAAIVEYL
jgi:NTE family protein